MKKNKLLIGIDFDGTLAECDDKHHDIHNQDVIPAMREKVKNWIEQGHEVYLFTAQAKDEDKLSELRKWLDENDLRPIKMITNEKQPKTDYYVDDQALKVEKNTGEIHCDPITKDMDSKYNEAVTARY